MRLLEFSGPLTPERFREFFMVYDALLPLEWRLYAMSDIDDQEIYEYFDRVVFRYDLQKTIPDISKMYATLCLEENWEDVLYDFSKRQFRGFDEINIESNLVTESMFSKLLDTNVRRININIFDKQQPTNLMLEYQKKFSEKDIACYIIKMIEDPEDYEDYSFTDYEGEVDPLPEPYQENGISYSILSDSLIYENGFYLNAQQIENPSEYFLQKDINPDTLLPLLLKNKIEYYKKAYEQISEVNMYSKYFQCIADNVNIYDDFNFIPNIILKPHTTFYSALIKNHGFKSTRVGLLRDKSINVIPLLNINKEQR